MSNFNERVNTLTELLNEGHITENEYLDLVDSLRGGSVNDVEGGVNIAGHQLDIDYQKEINNPDKLEDYEKFLSGDAFTDLHDPAFTDNDKEFEDFCKHKNPLHNTFYHVIDKKEVDSATKHFLEQAKLYQEHRGGRYNNSMNGLYKQDLRSGSILQGCAVVEGDGEIKCNHPFTSHEHNKQ